MSILSIRSFPSFLEEAGAELRMAPNLPGSSRRWSDRATGDEPFAVVGKSKGGDVAVMSGQQTGAADRLAVNSKTLATHMCPTMAASDHRGLRQDV